MQNGRHLSAHISLSFAFLLFLLFFPCSISVSLSLFFVCGNRCANYAMRNVIGKWQLVEWRCNCYDLPFTVGIPCMPHCHMPQPHSWLCLPACLLHGASIKDSIKFNWKCPREAADCNSNWQLQQLHRSTEKGGERGGRDTLLVKNNQSVVLCVLSVSLSVLAADSKSKNQLKIMCSGNRDRGAQIEAGERGTIWS